MTRARFDAWGEKPATRGVTIVVDADARPRDDAKARCGYH